MDLGAYCQIDDLDKIAQDNGIDVPRLRGYRLMSHEEPMSQKEIEEEVQYHFIHEAEWMIRRCPAWSTNPYSFHEYSPEKTALCDYYLVPDTDEGYRYKDIRWDRIHGKHRKNLKFALKKIRKRYQKQFDVYNKYCGQSGILYIHARIGGGNWNYYDGPELAKQPWFIEKVDDAFDNTYCDIYAKIQEPGDE